MSMLSPADRSISMMLPTSRPTISPICITRRSSSTSISSGTSSIAATSFMGVMNALLLQVDSGLTDLLGRRDYLGVGLIPALINNEVRKFARDIYGGGFQRSAGHLSAAARIRLANCRERS